MSAHSRDLTGVFFLLGSCTVAIAGEPTGACCLYTENGERDCQTLTEAECDAQPAATRYWEAGTGCAERPCPIIQCLDREGHCLQPQQTAGCSDPYCCSEICENHDSFCCTNRWDDTCVARAYVSCDLPALGSCCEHVPGGDETCVDGVEQSTCPATTYRIWIERRSCLDGFCPFPTGACCDRSPGSGGVCADGVLAIDCAGAFLSWSANTTCQQLPCTEAFGACCHPADGACEEGLLQAECLGDNGVWYAFSGCGQIACDAPIGACCDHGSGGQRASCGQITQAQCNCPACEWHLNEDCANIVCESAFTPIPTVSAWGLLTLALALLAGAKIWTVRRDIGQRTPRS